ncbi:MAG: CCA tRNA nucleotidyltransferase [Deltaproteobacteria bacterium]|nr:MAG: hypothetical protein B1H13_00540 [Desulfobacteraceae bacterium 4484_190.3]RLB18975.1 MAG: CCA tRNA nucleotidyltransferase [Deltaproteobacteria bacterium]
MRKPFFSAELHIPSFVSDALARLTHAGYEASIVGGALRDAFLDRPIPDWDIATSAPRQRIREVFSDRKTYHLKHETITIVLPKNRLEITPYRDPGRTLIGDLARRDFTINAMAFDPLSKQLIDPWNGRKDLAQKIIKGTENPELRFQEDPVRLLRGIRLSTDLGFEIHPQTLQAMHTHAHLVRQAARERIREELIKLLMSSRPSRGFRMLSVQGLLKHIIPELCEGEGIEQNIHHKLTVFDHSLKTMEMVPQVLHLRLAALLHDVAKPRVRTLEGDTWRFFGHARESACLANRIMENLRFSRSLTKKVVHLIMNHMVDYTPQWGDSAVRRLIRKAGPDNIDDLLLLRKADLLAHGTGLDRIDSLEELKARTAAILKEKHPISVHQLALNGNDVMEILHLGPGPRVGKVLQHLFEVVTESPELNNPHDLRALLEKDSLP